MKISRNTIVAFVAVVICILYGTIGIYLLRDQFHPVMSWVDALYYAMVTYATLGSDVMIPKTETARMYIVTMVVVGLGCFATVLTVVVVPFIENRIKKVMTMLSNIDHLNKHTIICGLNAITLQIAKAYKIKGTQVLFITNKQDQVSEMEALGINYIIDYAANKLTLEKAQFDSASNIICALENDAETILLVMRIYQLLIKCNRDKDVTLIAILQDPINEDSAHLAGAKTVLLPALLTSDALLPS